MSRTLPFAQHLLAMGRNLERLGQNHAASQLLSRLATFREVPQDLAEDTQLRLAELHLKCGHFKKARRHLASVLAVRPDNGQYHFLMAGAVEDDDTCDPRRALAGYRRCTKLDPANPEYWCALGVLALRLGETDEGLHALRRAHKLAPEDHEILSQAAEGLRDEGKTAEVNQLLKAALFRNPRDQRIRDLWMEHKLQLLYAGQQEAEQPGGHSDQRDPVILPFTRPTPKESTPGNKRIRRDLPSGTPGPKLPLRRRLSGKKSAQ